MSKESLDCSRLCSNYYSSWEEGCCMESCEFYNHNECPVVYVNGLLEERDKTIADLEAKLAELREQITILNEENSKTFMKSVNAWRENAELKQQLAEKDSTIKTLIEDSKASKELLKKQLAEKKKEIENIKLCRCVSCTNEYEFMLEGFVKDLEKQIDKDNQDKISFALEQLEKVKEKALHFYVNDTPELTGFYIDVNEINNQIEELKKEMK